MAGTTKVVDALVVGNGVAGRAAATALGRIEGWQVALVGRQEESLGLPIVLWRSGVDAAARLGLKPAVLEELTRCPLDGTRYRASTGDVVGDVTFDAGDGWLVDPAVLVDAMPADQGRQGYVFLGRKNLVRLMEEPRGVVAELDDGTKVRARVLVGATGAVGAVRSLVLGDDTLRREPAGIAVFTAPVPEAARKEVDRQVPVGSILGVLGPGVRFVALRREVERIAWWLHVAGGVPALGDPAGALARSQALLADFAPPVPDLAALPGTTCLGAFPATWTRRDVRQVVGRVALVGDEAHQMPPDLGLGVPHGLEDAVELADALREGPGPDAALRRWAASRAARVRPALDLSAVTSRLLVAGDPTVHRAALAGVAAGARLGAREVARRFARG